MNPQLDLEFDYSRLDTEEKTTSSNLYVKKMKEQAYALDLVSDILLPAHGTNGKKSCGGYQFKACDNHEKHTDGCTWCRKVPLNCGSLHCKVCFESAIAQRANAITSRMSAAVLLKANKRINRNTRTREALHVAVSPPFEEHYKFLTREGRKELSKQHIKILKKFDVDGGATIPHAYRFTENLEKAKFSPHYHNILTGWFDSDLIKQVNAETNWTVKVIRPLYSPKDIHGVANYLVSHCAVFLKDPTSRSSPQSISYFGDYNNRKFKVDYVSKFSESSFDSISKLIFDRQTKTIKGEEYQLRKIRLDHYEVKNRLKNATGDYEELYSSNINDLIKFVGKWITPKTRTELDNPAKTQSDPFELLQMKFEYANSEEHIVESEFVNLVLDYDNSNLCPECTQIMRTFVPSLRFDELSKSRFKELWDNLPDDGYAIRVDSLDGLVPMDFTLVALGLPFVSADGIWDYDTGVYSKPSCFGLLSTQIRDNIEKSIRVQEIKFQFKMQNGHSISKEELEERLTITMKQSRPLPKTSQDCHSIDSFCMP